jgi:hypothetical protein
MTWPAFLNKLFARVPPALVAVAGAGILAGLYAVPPWLNQKAADERVFQKSISRALEQTAPANEHAASLETLKAMDLEQLKVGINGSAQSQKSIFESGISLQEERRLLEKQLEIMTTYLLINPALQRVFLMRADQPLQSFLISYIPLHAYAGASALLPSSVRIISKERFAHPERGKSEEVNGSLQWIPPQVGTSVRSNALGEFVMFTNSGLILHGPPLNADDHERFPHVCLGLDQDAARALYRASFIGTRVVLSHTSIEKITPQPAFPPGTTTQIP